MVMIFLSPQPVENIVDNPSFLGEESQCSGKTTPLPKIYATQVKPFKFNALNCFN